MTRKKVKLALISNNTARKVKYRKRKKGIIKKVSELTILCGIPACAIICSPIDPKPEIWPDSEGAKEVIQRYLNASMLYQSKNVNQESFIMQRIARAHDQLRKQRQDNLEKELKKLDKLIEKNMKEIENKMLKITCEST